MQCRICLDDEGEEELEFISPCRCSGSSRYVHRKCLDTWISTCTNPEATRRCMECHYSYRFEYQREQYLIYFLQKVKQGKTPVLLVILFLIVFPVLLAMPFLDWELAYDYDSSRDDYKRQYKTWLNYIFAFWAGVLILFNLCMCVLAYKDRQLGKYISKFMSKQHGLIILLLLGMTYAVLNILGSLFAGFSMYLCFRILVDVNHSLAQSLCPGPVILEFDPTQVEIPDVLLANIELDIDDNTHTRNTQNIQADNSINSVQAVSIQTRNLEIC
jgi:hypothetical protein